MDSYTSNYVFGYDFGNPDMDGIGITCTRDNWFMFIQWHMDLDDMLEAIDKHEDECHG